MPLEKIPIPDYCPDLNQEIRLLMEYSEDQIESYQDDIGEQASPSFESADYREVLEALSWVRYNYPLPGLRFCEWGCGFAVVAGMAALMGMDAHGIENDKLLLDQAAEIKRLFGLASTIHSGDIYQVPEVDHPLHPATFDLIYAYPWPKEAAHLMAWFEEQAKPGACLLVYHGFSDLSFHRKC